MNVARLLVYNGVRTRRRIHDVEVRVTRELGELLGVGAIGVKIRRMVAVRQEIYRVADPHRLAVIAAGPGKFFYRIVGQCHDADRMRSAAAIVPPFAGLPPSRREGLGDFVVCQTTAVVWHTTKSPKPSRRDGGRPANGGTIAAAERIRSAS